MGTPSIAAVSTAVPDDTLTQDQALEEIGGWLEGKDSEELPFSLDRFRDIFRNAGVDQRRTVSTVDQMIEKTDFGEKSNRFLDEAKPVAREAITKAVDRAGIDLKDVDLFISVSCTGFTIPSLDAHLMNELDFSPDTRRLPIAELGCAAGVSGLSRAYDYLEAYPDANVLLLSTELCTINAQPSDLTRAQIIAGALFGDGTAAVIMTGEENSPAGRPLMKGYDSHFLENTLNYMGYKNNEYGMSIMLSPKIPAEVKHSGGKIIEEFLSQHELTPDDIDHFVVHPGGRAILDALDDTLDLDENDLRASRKTLKEYGNLSSATVFFVLSEILSEDPSPGDHGLFLAFGPGFNTDIGLLEW